MRFRKHPNIDAHFAIAEPLTHNSGGLNYTKEQLQRLMTGFSGRVTLQSDPMYDLDRQLFVPTFQAYPQVICYCQVESDVIKALTFARETELSPVCRSGGHSTAGFSANDEMIIDMSGVSYVTIDKAAMTMRVGGGTIFARINPMLDLHGVNITGGGCETVSVGGYMQGGGYGFTAQMNGMNCDMVIAARLALADGSVVTASEEENADLFWAIRGGTGNNFGVLLEVTYKLREMGKLWGFGMRWPLKTQREAAVDALQLWYDKWTGSAVPKGLGTQFPLASIDGEPYAILRGMYEGSEEELKVLCADLKATLADPDVQFDFWQQGTYGELNTALLSTPVEIPSVPMSSRSANTSRIMGDGLERGDFEVMVDLFCGSPVHTNMFLLESYGGAINEVAPDATAFVHRRGRFDMALYSFWMFQEDEAAALTYIDTFEDTLTPLSNGHAYQNYPNRKACDYANLYWGDNLPRLQKVKAKYDPKNFFHYPQSVPPLE